MTEEYQRLVDEHDAKVCAAGTLEYPGWREDAVDRLDALVDMDLSRGIDRTPCPFWLRHD